MWDLDSQQQWQSHTLTLCPVTPDHLKGNSESALDATTSAPPAPGQEALGVPGLGNHKSISASTKCKLQRQSLNMCRRL